MMREGRQYLWLRLTVLGTGAVLLMTFVVGSFAVWPIVQRTIAPTKLACGCAVLSVTTPWWMTTLSALLIVITGYVVVRAGWLFFAHLRRSHQHEAQLRRHGFRREHHYQLDMTVAVVNDHASLAVTAGFFRPTVYISQGLLHQLTGSEYRAVLQHERAHQRAYDPLVTALMDTVSRTFRWLPGARGWMTAAYSLRELAADAVATDGYRTTEALSSAFVKLSATTAQPQHSAFSPNRDRLEKLLDHRWSLPQRWWSWAGFGVATLLFSATTLLGHVASAKTPAVPPAAAAACHETIVMCREARQPFGTLYSLCAAGRCVTQVQLRSPLYALTPVR